MNSNRNNITCWKLNTFFSEAGIYTAPTIYMFLAECKIQRAIQQSNMLDPAIFNRHLQRDNPLRELI